MESLVSLQYIIENKYSAVLKLEDGYIYGQDGVKEYLEKEKGTSDKSSRSREHASISMTITINQVDQEVCGHFLWDLAHKAIRDKFKFDFDAASNSALIGSNRATIAINEFEAQLTFVTRAFKYLAKEPRDQTTDIGRYLVYWLPFHLEQLRKLEEQDKGALTSDEQFEIGKSLYNLFKSDEVVRRHRAIFQRAHWPVENIEHMQTWLLDWSIVRRLDKSWRDGLKEATTPTRGFLKHLAEMVVEGFLRERSWDVDNAYLWIEQFMLIVSLSFHPPLTLVEGL